LIAKACCCAPCFIQGGTCNCKLCRAPSRITRPAACKGNLVDSMSRVGLQCTALHFCNRPQIQDRDRIYTAFCPTTSFTCYLHEEFYTFQTQLSFATNRDTRRICKWTQITISLSVWNAGFVVSKELQILQVSAQLKHSSDTLRLDSQSSLASCGWFGLLVSYYHSRISRSLSLDFGLKDCC